MQAEKPTHPTLPQADVKITTIGGGTGAPSVLRALALAQFTGISAVTASMDSGGKTGHIRTGERDRVIAMSDLIRSMLAMIPPEQNHSTPIRLFTEMMNYVDGRGQNLGYSITYGMMEKYDNDYKQVQQHFAEMLGIGLIGLAIPVTLESTHICFQTQSGAVHKGEHLLDELSMSPDSVTGFWLEPEVTATQGAIQAVTDADWLIFCPGTMYGSVLPNCLPSGMKEAFASSKAKTLVIPNLTSDRNQTHKITADEYVQRIEDCSGKPVDLLLCADTSGRTFQKLYPQVVQNYQTEYSHYINWSQTQVARLPHTQTIRADIMDITPLGRIRHSSEKMADVLDLIIRQKVFSPHIKI